MRRLLVLIAALSLFLLIGNSHSSLAQELYAQCTVGMPASTDFPEAETTCQRKLKLEPWIGTPDVVFTLTGLCVLKVTVCGGKTLCYKSAVRNQEGNWCADYRAVADRMTSRTICCDPKCEKPTPWFDGLSPNPKCKDRQSFRTSDDGKGWVYLEMCGWKVFAHNIETTDSLYVAAYKEAMLQSVHQTVGSTVCCDSFKTSARPGTSCDPRFDMDCDGTSNATDHHGEHRDAIFPDISTFAIAPGSSFRDTDPLPPWFQPGDKGFMPDASLCDCKWELVRGRRTCSPDGKGPHVYQTTWRCPTTGNERFTRKEAAATQPCGPAAETTALLGPPSACEPMFQFAAATFHWPGW